MILQTPPIVQINPLGEASLKLKEELYEQPQAAGFFEPDRMQERGGLEGHERAGTRPRSFLSAPIPSSHLVLSSLSFSLSQRTVGLSSINLGYFVTVSAVARCGPLPTQSALAVPNTTLLELLKSDSFEAHPKP